MSQSPSDAPPVPSANERWKERGRLRTVTSMAIAFALHASVFLIWRVHGITNPMADSPMPAVEVVQLDRSAAAGSETRGTAVPIPAAPVPVPASPETDEQGGGESDDGDQGSGEDARLELAGSSASLFERLRNRAPRPRVTESEPDPELLTSEEPSSPDEEEVSATGADPSTARALESSMNLSAVDLERLSAVRPKVVLTAPSGWVLVRNRSRVRSFVKYAYRRGRVDPDATGSVSVALWIDEEGSVDWAEITDSSGREDLDRVALELFEDVVDFMPARDGGTPVGTSAIFTVVFPWP